jgi:hypothetical protein
MSKFTKKEKEFADELAKYENQWVAIKRSGSDEKIVASGKRITDAKREAEKKGEKEVFYLKVPSSHKILIA